MPSVYGHEDECQIVLLGYCCFAPALMWHVSKCLGGKQRG